MKRVAFLTYNTVGDGMENGWHEGLEGRKAFLLQGYLSHEQRRLSENLDEYAASVGNTIDSLWRQLRSELDSIDHVVIYLGVRGAECLVELATHLTASKVMFVACNCSVPGKVLVITAMGMLRAPIVPCECGGRRTMKSLFRNFMESGEFVLQPIKLI